MPIFLTYLWPMESQDFKAGFISILGKPNVGKSTLMNAIVGERLSIATSKAQTTRHRIFGIMTGSDFQMVFSDTPGVISPGYELQESMMKFVKAALEDADLILLVVELNQKHSEDQFFQRIIKGNTKIILVINKMDQAVGTQLQDKLTYWRALLPKIEIFPVSALKKENIEPLFIKIRDHLPNHPPYFSKDALTDKPERFFAAEIIREKIFTNYKKEVPYSCEVAVTEFKEEQDIIRIRAEIFVERDSQKGILIGHRGASLKKVGIESRKDMEQFFQKKIHVETYVKVGKNWRKDKKQLRRFGYE